MLRLFACLFTIFTLTASAPLWSQDLLGSTGSTTRSYSFVEVQYLPDLDADLPLLATIVVDVADSISVTGQYLKQSTSLIEPETQVEFDLDGEALSIGLLYHQTLDAISDSDWVAGLSLGRVRAEGSALNGLVTAKSSEEFQEGYIGIRRTMTNTIEAEFGLTALRLDGDTDVTGEFRAVFRIRPSLDIALALNEIGEADLFGVGFRYTW